MCKLVAYVSLNNKDLTQYHFNAIEKMFKHLFYINSFGNKDGSGLMLMEADGKAYYYKRGLPSTDFIQLDIPKDLMVIDKDTKFLAGHTRYGTVGGTSDRNAHPFHYGDILLMQNGTSNYGYYNLVEGKVDPDYLEVDSEHVCWAINEQGYEKTFEEYEGAGVFLWIDIKKKTFNVLKNNERDLHICKLFNADVYMITTDPYALEYAANRAGVSISKVIPVKNNVLITYTLDGKVEYDSKVSVKQEVSYAAYKGYKSNLSKYSYYEGTKGGEVEVKVIPIKKDEGYVGECCCCGNPVFNTEEYLVYKEGGINEYICESCSEWAPEAFGIDSFQTKTEGDFA